MAKSLLLGISLSLLISTISFSQTFSVAKDSVKFTGKPTSAEFNARIHVYNLTSGPLKLKITRDIVSLSPEWETSFCTQTNCLDKTDEETELNLSAGAQNYLLVHFFPNKKEGEGQVNLHVVDVDNPENTKLLVYLGSAFLATNNTTVDKHSTGIFNVYPNPVKELIYIESKDISGSATYEVFDALGKTVATGRIQSGNNKAIIDASAFEKGVYFIKIYEGNNFATKKLVKN
jgi:hypothetical protein